MATRRGNTRVTVLATLAVLVFGLVVAGTILAVTGRAKTPRITGPIPFGVARSLKETAKDGGPFAFAGDSGDNGFWIAIEDGKLVALKIQKPGTKDCNVIWKGSKDTFQDCNGDPIRMDQLERYASRTPTTGKNKGLWLVNLRHTLPAPSAA